jgi:hypothetical protein
MSGIRTSLEDSYGPLSDRLLDARLRPGTWRWRIVVHPLCKLAIAMFELLLFLGKPHALPLVERRGRVG